MARPRKTDTRVNSLGDCAAALSELLAVTLELERLIAQRDEAVALSQKQFEFDLDTARFRKADIEEALKRYYYEHLDALEVNGARHVQLSTGVIGRRTSPPALKPFNRNWTWAAIKQALRAKFGPKYFHEPKDPEIDKDALKAAQLDPTDLKSIGLKLEQDEVFYAEPARLPGGSAA